MIFKNIFKENFKFETKPTNLVFCNDDGSIRSYDATRRVFDRFAKKHGFRQEFGLRCHMLRQTFSNMQIENKRNIKDVQHLLGHKDAKTTVNTKNR
ncbi:MAG: tyrosine-type recombinase/integrase [Christensenellales bacterium]